MRKQLYVLLSAIFMVALMWGCSGGGGGTSTGTTPGTQPVQSSSITVEGQIQEASASGLTIAAFTLPENNTVKIYNTQTGAEITSGSIDSSGKFSVTVDLPSEKKISLTIAANFNGTGYRTILPIDLSSMPSSFVGSNNASVVLNSTTTQISQQILGDGFKLEGKTFDEIKTTWVDAGGSFLGYFSGNIEVRGKIDTSLPGSATLLTSTDLTKEACNTCHQKTTWGDLSVASSHAVPASYFNSNANITVTNNSGRPSIDVTLPQELSSFVMNSENLLFYRGNPAFFIMISEFDNGQWKRICYESGTQVDNPNKISSSSGSFTYSFATTTTCDYTNLDFSNKLYKVGVSFITKNKNEVGLTKEIGNTSLAYKRNLATQNACMRCHDSIGFSVHKAHLNKSDNYTDPATNIHYTARNGIDNCVQCHNPNTGAQSNLTVYAHGYHAGKMIPGGKSKMFLNSGTTYRESEIGYPNRLADCAVCHDGNDKDKIYQFGGTTTNASVACGSCHQNIFRNKNTFKDGHTLSVIHVTPPSNISYDNFTAYVNNTTWKWAFSENTCGICHNGSMVPDIKEAHKDIEGENGKGILYVIDNISYDSGTRKITVNWHVEKNGNKLNLLNTDPDKGPIFINVNRGGLSYSVGLLFAFKTADDYTNQGIGSNSAQPASVTISDSNTKDPDGDLIFTTTYTVPANVTATQGTVAVQGIPVVKGSKGMEYARVNSVTKSFALSEDASDRRKTVDINKCNSCHGNIVFHGHYRINNIELCATCHNPSATEKNRRNDWFALGVGKLDGKDEESYNLQYMIHSIHAVSDTAINPDGTPYILYRGTGTTGGSGIYLFGSKKPVGWWDNDSRFIATPIEYPSSAKNCTKCHTSTPGFVDSKKAVAFTVGQGSSLTTDSDDTVIGPNAAACKSCHKSQNATNHIMKNTFYGILTSLVDKLKIALGQ